MEKDNLFDNLEKNKDIFKEKEKTTKIKNEIKVAKKGRQVKDEPLSYEIDDNDPELVRILKGLINDYHPKKSEVYAKFGRSEGYNMIYSLKRNQLSWDRFSKWLEVMNLEVRLDIIEK